MADKPDKQKALRELVEKEMPNFRFVERVTADSRSPEASADAVTPDLATLRRKFLGQDAPAEKRRARSATAASASEETEADTLENAEIVLVEPKNADSRDRRAGAKAVVISKGKIIGVQG